MNDTELTTFIAEAVSTLSPLVTEIRDYECGGGKDGMVYINAKTHRSSWGYDDCDGTANPDKSAMEAAQTLGKKYGFHEVRWEPCEKGWGSFYFYTKLNCINQLKSSLEYARKNWREYNAECNKAKGQKLTDALERRASVEKFGKGLKAELEALENS